MLTNWTAHNMSLKQQGDKDYAALNRLALKGKATTSDKQYSFRQTVNARLKDPLNRKDLNTHFPFDDNSTFGTANRPSTPIKAVVEGFFGDVAEQQTLQRYEMQSQRPGTAGGKSTRKFSQMRSHTRAS